MSLEEEDDEDAYGTSAGAPNLTARYDGDNHCI